MNNIQFPRSYNECHQRRRRLNSEGGQGVDRQLQISDRGYYWCSKLHFFGFTLTPKGPTSGISSPTFCIFGEKLFDKNNFSTG